MSRQSELAQLGRVFDNSALSNRNLIINGAMQVAQRGTSFTTNGYSLDRWYGNQVSSISQYTDASGQKWLDFSNGNTWSNIHQKIEDGLYRVRNKTITLSFDWEQVVAGAVAEVRFFNNIDLDTYVAIPNPSVAERKTITVDIGNVGDGAGGWLGVAFYNSKSTFGSGRFRLSNVQLEVGDTATPFEHRSYGQELALAQRFFEIIDSNLYFSPQQYVDIHYCVRKRAIPSVSLTSTYASDCTVSDSGPAGFIVVPNYAHSYFAIRWTADAEL